MFIFSLKNADTSFDLAGTTDVNATSSITYEKVESNSSSNLLYLLNCKILLSSNKADFIAVLPMSIASNILTYSYIPEVDFFFLLLCS